MKVKYIASFAMISILSLGLVSCFSGTSVDGGSEKTTIEDPCAGAKDPCAGAEDPCAGVKDPCAGAKDPCAGAKDPCAGATK